MPKQCEVYLEKIQERGSKAFSYLNIGFLNLFHIAVENLHGSSMLQQSMNDMQNLQAQHSFYSDPQCKIFLFKQIKKLCSICFSNNFIK